MEKKRERLALETPFEQRQICQEAQISVRSAVLNTATNASIDDVAAATAANPRDNRASSALVRWYHVCQLPIQLIEWEMKKNSTNK